MNESAFGNTAPGEAAFREAAFSHRIVGHLSAAAREIDDPVRGRLRMARERALAARWPEPERERLVRANLGLRLRFGFAHGLRAAALMVAVLAVFVAGEYRASSAGVRDFQEVDAVLLMDDLPLDAYLDPDFKVWVFRQLQS